MNSIQPNDIKKGDIGYLKNTGWKFEMMDNKKGNIRMAKVHGFETEIGSIYTHDIAFIEKDGNDVPVDASRYQAQTTMIKNLGF
jgi:hypothetical protein